MKTVAEVIGVSRSNLADCLQERCKKRIGRPPLPDDELVSKIKAVVAELPTYGYRRVHAVLKRQALAAGLKPPNHKRVYRVMKVHGLLLDRHVGGEERRHDGRIAVDERNRRWCSDGFEIGCDNGERVRVAFALDCCDREAMSFLATTGGIAGEEVRDLMVAAVEYRFGQVNRLPVTIEWLSDNGSCYVAGDTRSFARDIGLEPRTTPLESPQSNGMAEAFVRTIKRDYVRVSPRPDAETVSVSCQLGSPTTTRFTRTRLSDIVHPVSSSQPTQDPDRVRSFGGHNTLIDQQSEFCLISECGFCDFPCSSKNFP
jgi:putative transposase